MSATCRSCGAAIVWALTQTEKRMPVDAAPSARGNLVLSNDADGKLRVRNAGDDDPTDQRHTSHFVTCPAAAEHRRAKSHEGGPAHLIIDIETVRDPELGEWTPKPDRPDALPPPAWHRVIAIAGLGWDRAPCSLDLLGPAEDERAQLAEFARYLAHRPGPVIVTWNGRRFDLPVIAMRALRHGVPIPAYYAAKDYRYRFTSDGHFDVADYLADFGAGSSSSLGDVSRLCGLPGKLGGIDGSQVGEMYAAGRIEEIRRYCLRDVVETAFVWLRTELLRGSMTPEQHHAAASKLWDFAAADERVRDLLEGCDRARVTLAPSGVGQEAA